MSQTLKVFDILELWHDKSKEVEEQSKENGINIVYHVINFIKRKVGKATGFFGCASEWRCGGGITKQGKR